VYLNARMRDACILWHLLYCIYSCYNFLYYNICNAITWVYATVNVNDTNALFPHIYVVYWNAIMRGVCSLYVWYCTVVDIYQISNIVTIMIIWYYAITWAYATMSVNDVNALFPRMFVVYLNVTMREIYTLYQWYGKVVGMHRNTNIVTIMTIWYNAITWVYATVSVNDANALFPRLYMVYLSVMACGACTLYEWYCKLVGM
jgi:hypothetical protein